MNTVDMNMMGFNDAFAAHAADCAGLYVGRIIAQYKDLYQVIGAGGELMAEVSGKLRFAARTPAEFPAVGDFVMMDRQNDRDGNAIIQQVLPRKSAFIRKAAGTTNEEQVVASNIDTVFLCMSLNHDFSLRRLERYLSIAWDSGAMPVVVLTKADLCGDVAARLDEVRRVAMGADILVTSAIGADGFSAVLRYMKKGMTAALIGSSGVGKSTLINCLLGKTQQRTNGLRNDDKGKHTTTSRALIVLNNGSMVIDTPGMREMGLENADLAKSFADIDELAGWCKFRDCAHNQEKGCAVQQAIQDGRLSAERLASYRKLKREVAYEGLQAKQIETLKLNEMFSSVGGMKRARKALKDKQYRK